MGTASVEIGTILAWQRYFTELESQLSIFRELGIAEDIRQFCCGQEGGHRLTSRMTCFYNFTHSVDMRTVTPP